MCEKCIQCGNSILVVDTKKFPKTFCSYNCYETWNKFHKTPNCKCDVCGKEMYLKPSRLKRVKNGITCSIECASILKSTYMQGDKNHQFGVKGSSNASFQGETIEHRNNGIMDIMVYEPTHPRANQYGRVVKHRLVVEKNWSVFGEIYFDAIGEWHILKEGLQVHHKDCNHDNNNVDNLQIVTKSEHRTIHNNIVKDKLQRYEKIIGVIKRGELLENPEMDNQQPSSSSNITEGSTTNNRVLHKDSNVDTSALLQEIKQIIEEDIV